jgi:putative membrane protein
MEKKHLMEAVLESLTAGFPVLLLHFLVTVTMLAVGVVIYLWMTPYPELQLIRNGNIAAAISLGAAILSLAIPLAFSMSVSVSVVDIIAWGLVTLAILLIVYRGIDFLMKDLPKRIEDGEMGPALLLASVKLGVAAITAAAVSG